jgi:heat-inducible transcriptional repressor
MNTRQEHLLSIIVKEHLESATPVGSTALVEKYNLDISSATVRNEMAALEEQGYIAQPHTSAGRVPTEAAFQWFSNHLDEYELNREEKATLDEAIKAGLKPTAKALAEISGLAIFWAFHRHNVYYTGICNLLGQPEFANKGVIYDLSTIIDRVDEIVNDLFDRVPSNPKIMIGQDSPFGSFFGSIVCKYKTDEIGIFGVLGPLRMDYARNLTLIKYIKEQLG